MTIQNTADLRKMLIDSIDAVRKGKLDHRQALAISGLSSRVLQSARLDLDVLKMNQGQATVPKAVSLMAPKLSKAKRHAA